MLRFNVRLKLIEARLVWHSRPSKLRAKVIKTETKKFENRWAGENLKSSRRVREISPACEENWQAAHGLWRSAGRDANWEEEMSGEGGNVRFPCRITSLRVAVDLWHPG